ncbi:MAG TPA: hypothetical protein VMD79_11710 [Solirubrobacteraceae bacterium]|nr:hypothetical protein [Solirubrobacteraceae bacterium]
MLAAPTGEFAPFAQCPLSTPKLSGCIFATTESGEVTIGKSTVPITNPITLQGGFIESRTSTEDTFVEAANGETLSRSPQPVPGGLAGLVKCDEITGTEPTAAVERLFCETVFQNGLTGVTATTELAAPASSIGLDEENLLEETGTALELPVKVKLSNPLLGEECYIGTNANHITFNLTTGTTSPPSPNKPIKGKKGTLTDNEEGNILTIIGNSLVDNSFSAPEASGCGGPAAFLLDPVIDLKLGLPAAAGENTAILDGTLKQAGKTAVEEHSS